MRGCRSSDCWTDVRHSLCARFQRLCAAAPSCSAHVKTWTDMLMCWLPPGLWFKLPPAGRYSNAAPAKTTAINLVQLLHFSFPFPLELITSLRERLLFFTGPAPTASFKSLPSISFPRQLTLRSFFLLSNAWWDPSMLASYAPILFCLIRSPFFALRR